MRNDLKLALGYFFCLILFNSSMILMDLPAYNLWIGFGVLTGIYLILDSRQSKKDGKDE